MKISNEILKSKDFIKLIETYDDNLFVNDLINEFLSNRFDINKEYIESKMNEENIDSNEAFNLSFLESLNLEMDKLTFNKLKDYELLSIKELNRNEYINNSYYKDIKINEYNENGYHLYYKSYLPYESFIMDDITSKNKNCLEINHLGYFKDEFKLISLDKDDETWMLISPHEINTMKNYISLMNGKCLIYGLGLGYFPYMLSLKNEVKEITIIEKDENIINIFNKFILPQFKNKSKIKIINKDAIEFNKDIKNNEYDNVFIDLWHNQMDGLKFYLYFKKNELENTKYYYWIEDSLICYLRRMLITLLIEYKEGFNKNNYKKSQTFEDKIINSLYFYLENEEFNVMDDIYNLINEDNIKNIVKNLRAKTF